MSSFYEPVATNIDTDYSAITASPVCLLSESPKLLAVSSSIDPTQTGMVLLLAMTTGTQVHEGDKEKVTRKTRHLYPSVVIVLCVPVAVQ